MCKWGHCLGVPDATLLRRKRQRIILLLLLLLILISLLTDYPIVQTNFLYYFVLQAGYLDVLLWCIVPRVLLFVKFTVLKSIQVNSKFISVKSSRNPPLNNTTLKHSGIETVELLTYKYQEHGGPPIGETQNIVDHPVETFKNSLNENIQSKSDRPGCGGYLRCGRWPLKQPDSWEEHSHRPSCGVKDQPPEKISVRYAIWIKQYRRFFSPVFVYFSFVEDLSATETHIATSLYGLVFNKLSLSPSVLKALPERW